MEKAFEKTIRVVVIDDHPAVREAIGIGFRCRPGIVMSGQTAEVAELFRLLASAPIDVVIVDLSLGEIDGLDLVARIREGYPNVRVVVYSLHDEHVFAERALQAGANGYVMKSQPTQVLVDAVRTVAAGRVALSRVMQSNIIGRVQARGGLGSFAIGALTERERAVFHLSGEGMSAIEIAARLNLNRKTVESYRRSVKEKLGYNSISRLIHHAIQWQQHIDKRHHLAPLCSV